MARLRSNTGDPRTELARLLRTKDEAYWLKNGEKQALANFRHAAEVIPAYGHFLKKHKINPARIRTIRDFAHLPETNKKNYILKYPLSERSPNGNFSFHKIIAASSGTTGTPTLWPRGIAQEEEAAIIHDLIFSEQYEVDAYRTVAVIGFPMGVYVSGIATTVPSVLTALQHKNLSVVTPGNNKESILSIIPTLQKGYEQIILIGHPFFVKDVIESGKKQGISWGKTKLRTFFCSEGFNETWRDYLASLVPRSRPENDFLNFYGSSELLLMGYETPESIRIRQRAERESRLCEELFKSSIAPNLFQFIPQFRYIESNASSELLFTAWSGVPLVRFNIHDQGFVMTREEVLKAFPQNSAPFKKKSSWRPWHIPYVALYGRSDHTLVFYAANLYPEHIHEALNAVPFLKKITGKFSMEKNYTSSMDQRLIIHIELQEKEHGGASLQLALKKRIVATLEKLNMEYLFLRNNLDKDLVPKIALHPYRDNKYFRPGLKPRYIIK